MGGGISKNTAIVWADVKYSPFFLLCRVKTTLIVSAFPVIQWPELLVLLRTVWPLFFLKLTRKESSLSSVEMDANPTVTHHIQLISSRLNGDFFFSLKINSCKLTLSVI